MADTFIQSKITRLRLVFGILAMFTLLDFYFTQILINHGDFSVEINPILHHLIQTTGSVWSIIATKVAGLVFLAGTSIFVCKYRPHKIRFLLVLLSLITFLQGIVAILGWWQVATIGLL